MVEKKLGEQLCDLKCLCAQLQLVTFSEWYKAVFANASASAGVYTHAWRKMRQTICTGTLSIPVLRRAMAQWFTIAGALSARAMLNNWPLVDPCQLPHYAQMFIKDEWRGLLNIRPRYGWSEESVWETVFLKKIPNPSFLILIGFFWVTDKNLEG